MTAFLIYAHNDPLMLARLCARLAPFPVYVHIDAKVSIEPFIDALRRPSLAHVRLLEDRVPVYWGGYSQVEAMRLLIRAAASEISPSDYLVMLSGQDYPTRPVSELDRLLRESNGRQFIRCFRIMESEPAYVRQVTQRHFRDIRVPRIHGRTRSLLVRALDAVRLPLAPPDGITICHGQTHWAMTVECAVDADDRLSPPLEHYFRRCFAPDEKVYHSLVVSGNFAGAMQDGGPTSYSGRGNWRYTNFHHVHPSLRKTYAAEDFEEVAGSDKFFVRKVNSTVSRELLDRIDTELLRL